MGGSQSVSQAGSQSVTDGCAYLVSTVDAVDTGECNVLHASLIADMFGGVWKQCYTTMIMNMMEAMGERGNGVCFLLVFYILYIHIYTRTHTHTHTLNVQ